MPDAATSARFEGFPIEGIEFYRRLATHNTRAFWAAERETYERCVKAPMLALTDELAVEFGVFHVFRPNRDLRFSKDKSPYKTHQGAATEGEGGETYYLHIDGDGLLVASGYYRMAKDQLDRYRRAVDDDVSGPDLVRRVAAVEGRYDIGGSALSTAPRGYPRDHERVALLRHKGLSAGRSVGAPGWLATRRAKQRIVELWRGAQPLNEWLNRHVGPSQLPPDDRR